MRKTKADMVATKEDILSAAFQSFSSVGFDKASLETIAADAGVTRGAIYWHFSDKENLYRAVVTRVIERADVPSYADRFPTDTELVDKLCGIFWIALDNNKYVDFVFSTVGYVSANKEKFLDLWENVTEAKLRLLYYIDSEIVQYCKEHQLETENSGEYSRMLFLLFEGLFLAKQISAEFVSSKEQIKKQIAHVLSDLMRKGDC